MDTFKSLPDIYERIQTLDDVYELIGLKGKKVPYSKPKNKKELSTNAFMTIQHITEAYGMGGQPNFDDASQSKYYLYFIRKNGGWVLGDVGVGCLAYAGAGHYFPSREIALDVWKKFPQVWLDYLPE